MDVDEEGGLFEGYELKLNSYDLGVDIELADIVQRLRFEHPEVSVVMLGSERTETFCAGANIRMLAQSDHAHKVNFCKFTNETRSAIEDATANSGQTYVAALNGPAAGGGYELALACEEILLIDDGNAAVSLPEVPLLGVLPGTGGLTRLVDKRGVRRDLADRFCTLEEGLRADKALEQGFIDRVASRSSFDTTCLTIEQELTETRDIRGIELGCITKEITEDRLVYASLGVELNRDSRSAEITILGPQEVTPGDAEAALAEGAAFWPLLITSELDDCLLELRFNEPEIGTLIFKSQGSLVSVQAYDRLMVQEPEHWFLREVRLYVARTLRRLDLTAKSIMTLVEPGSCFAGFLAEIVFAADQGYMLEGTFEEDEHPEEASLALSDLNFGSLPMVNGLSRLATRFLHEPSRLDGLRQLAGDELDAAECDNHGLITAAYDDLDWEDEIRLVMEARAGMSPDALTGMEASLRFPGPETMDSKIFARLSAWQNWIFQRPNAVGESGALPLYGTGRRPEFDPRRT